MSLQPTLSFLCLGDPSAPHSLEFYIDFQCPFSAKIFFNAIDPILKPTFSDSGKYARKVRIILRLQPQPWHACSAFLHEAALAVGRVAPTHFWEYVAILFKNQEAFFNVPTSSLTPLQVREKLVALAPAGVDKSKVQDLLTHKTTPNGGIDVADDLKYNIKIGRQNGIHVTPTAVWDGLTANEVSSSWGKEEWDKFLSSKILV
ncbi:thioredoxin [Ceratobasidium sp. AG-Ba]|nr:thioredoxin [Ceratobasidium sp. AG-Ba]